MNTRSFVLAALIGGFAMALLGNLPLINLLNCILCLWVWLGGALAVVLYRRFSGGAPGLTAGQGAAIGAVAGLVGAVIGFFIGLAFAAISAPIMENVLRTLAPDTDLPTDMFDPRAGLGGAILGLVVDLVLYSGFGALAGLITANIGKPKAVPPVPMPPPMPPTTP